MGNYPFDLSLYRDRLLITMGSDIDIAGKVFSLISVMQLLKDDPRSDAARLRLKAEMNLSEVIQQHSTHGLPMNGVSEAEQADLLFTTGALLEKYGEYEQAIGLYKKLIQQFIDSTDIEVMVLVASAMLNHAQIIEQMGRQDIAQFQYRAIARKFGHYDYIDMKPILNSASVLAGRD